MFSFLRDFLALDICQEHSAIHWVPQEPERLCLNRSRPGPGQVEPLGDQSEYYNFADMVNRAKESFPGETVYYKLVTTDEYVSLIITTEKKKNVYFDRYTPVDGKVGDEDVAYKLEISMVSDAMQPDDILHNYTGILKQ